MYAFLWHDPPTLYLRPFPPLLYRITFYHRVIKNKPWYCIALRIPGRQPLYCIVLQCITQQAIVLHCIAVHYATSHCIALYCSALRNKPLYCIELQCITQQAIACIVLQCIMHTRTTDLERATCCLYEKLGGNQ